MPAMSRSPQVSHKEAPARRFPWRKLLALLGAATALGLAAASPADSPTRLRLTSTAFKDGASIPRQYTGDGNNLSPPLAWSGAPRKTRSFALICDDPDAKEVKGVNKVWVHWVLFNLPATVHELKQGVPTRKVLSNGARQGRNDSGKTGYSGPAPPRGKPHRYYFKLYALDARLDLPAGATKKQLLTALKGHILAEGRLMGKYGR